MLLLNAVVAKDLARIIAQLGGEAAEAFRAAWAASAPTLGQRAALGAAWNIVAHEFKRDATSKVWQKRADGDAPPAKADVTFGCPCCGKVQPKFVCGTCGDPGPGVFCPWCCSGLRTGSCPSCNVYWDPVSVQDRAAGEDTPLTVIPLVDVEVRAAPEGKRGGTIVGYATADVMDAHGSIINIDEVDRNIIPGVTKIDEEHNKKAVPGVEIVRKWRCERALKDPKTGKEKLVQCIGVEVLVGEDAPPEFLARFREITRKDCYRGFSIGFYPEPESYKAWISGETTRIEKINSIPWLSATAKPSNWGSNVIEIRSEFDVLCERSCTRAEPEKKPDPTPTPESTPTLADAKTEQTTLAAGEVDLLAEIKKDVEAGAPATGQPPAAAQPTASPAPVATLEATESVTTAQFAALEARVTALVTEFETHRAAPALPEQWRAELTGIRTAVEALVRDAVQGHEADQQKTAKELEQVRAAMRGLWPLFRAHLEARIATLKAPAPPIGNPGDLAEIALAEAARGNGDTSDKKAQLERERDIREASLVIMPRPR